MKNKMLLLVFNIVVATSLLPYTQGNNNCRGLDILPEAIDEMVAKSQACNAVEVMKSVESAAKCAAVKAFGFGEPTSLYSSNGNPSEYLCSMINEVLSIGIPIPADQCSQITTQIMNPLVRGEIDLVDVESFVTPILEGIVEASIDIAQTGVETFSSFVDSFNVCLPVNVNPHYWKAKVEKIIQLFKKIKEGTDYGRKLMRDMNDMSKCRVYSVIFTLDIDALAIFGKQAGLYVTFNLANGLDFVDDVGSVSAVAASYNLDPDLDVSIGATFSVVMGAMSAQEWGYSIELGASVPVYGIGVGLAAGLLFTADPETKALGNFNGFSMSASAKIGESSVSIDFDASVSCAYSTAQSFTNSFDATEQSMCGNVGESRIKSAASELKASTAEAWNAIKSKADELERCAGIYACEAKRCAYNFNEDNYENCKDMANTCSDDMKECGDWANECEKRTTVQKKASCKKHHCRKVKEKTSCKKHKCREVKKKAGCKKRTCRSIKKKTTCKTKECRKVCDKVKNKCGPFQFVCDAFKLVCKTTCDGSCIAWNYATEKVCDGACIGWNYVTKKVCDGACTSWNYAFKKVCDGSCMVWNYVAKEVVDTVVTAGDCAAKGMVQVAEKVKCLKYLPKCVGTPFCYSSKATVGALKCTSGMIVPSEKCLRENGFA